MKQWICLLLCAVLLTGCAAGGTMDAAENKQTQEDGKTAAGGGRYLESELILPEQTEKLYAAAKLKNGELEILTWNKKEHTYEIYTSSDEGENWQRCWSAQDVPEEKAALFQGYQSTASIRDDGTAVMVRLNYQEQQYQSTTLTVISPEKADAPGEGWTAEQIELHLPEPKNSGDSGYAGNIVDSAFQETGSFFVENLEGRLFGVDLATGQCSPVLDLSESAGRYFDTAGDLLIGVSPDRIALYDSAAGEELPEDTFFSDMLTKNPSLASKNSEYGKPLVFAGLTGEKTIFYVCHEGLFCHTPGGSVSEQLVQGTMTTMGDTSVSFLDFIVMDEKTFLLSCMDGTGVCRLLRYSYDAHAPSTPETELNVYALEDSVFLRQAVSLYQKQNPNVYVKLQIGMSGEDGITAEDAVHALGTEILAGNAPDVLILDGLPVESYVEKGVLADISGLVNEIADTDGCFSNIRQAYETDGKIYAFPAKFYVTLAAGEPDALAAAESIGKLASFTEAQRAAGRTKVFPVRIAERLLDRLYLADCAQWMGEDGTLSREKLVSWLSDAKKIYDAEPMQTQNVVGYGGKMAGLTGTMDNVGVMLKESSFGYGTVTGIAEVVQMVSANKRAGMDYDLADRAAGGCFVPYQIAGITQNTVKREEAEAFLRTMFGKECSSTDQEGFPVNRAAYDKLCADAKTQFDEYYDAGIAVSTDDGTYLELDFENLTDADIAKLTGILEEVTLPACMDKTVNDIVMEQALGVLHGDWSTDEAVDVILKKCNLYLTE